MKQKLFTKERITNGLNGIWEITKSGLKILIPIVATGLANNMTKKVSDKVVRYYGDPDYGDAIQAITDSDMYSNHIVEATGLVRKGEDSDYYSAVIAIAESDMYSNHKVVAISKLNTEQ